MNTLATEMESSDSERCILVTELAQVLDMVRQLEAHMDQSSTTAGELCRALASKIHLSIDKSIHMARSCCPEARLGPESPWSADGSPNSDASDQAGNIRCHDNVGKEVYFKKRKTMPKMKNQVRVRSVADAGPLDDGFSWRKYGQKEILGAKYPRAYFRCTHRTTQSCFATKQVQRTDGDPLLFDVVYQGTHTCIRRTHCNQKSSPISTDKSQSSQEQSFLTVKTEGPGLDAMPFSFPSTPVGTDNNAINSCFLGSFASPFVSPATSESNYSVTAPQCQISSSYAGGLGIQNLDTELASAGTSTTNSPMADMDFVLRFDDDFLDTSGLF